MSESCLQSLNKRTGSKGHVSGIFSGELPVYIEIGTSGPDMSYYMQQDVRPFAWSEQ